MSRKFRQHISFHKTAHDILCSVCFSETTRKMTKNWKENIFKREKFRDGKNISRILLILCLLINYNGIALKCESFAKWKIILFLPEPLFFLVLLVSFYWIAIFCLIEFLVLKMKIGTCKSWILAWSRFYLMVKCLFPVKSSCSRDK